MVDDPVLVARSRRGERAAFEELIRRHGRLLHGQVFVWLGTREGVDDVCQEALLKAFRQLDTLRDPAQFRGWLLRIAQRLTVDRHRRRGRAPFESGKTEGVAGSEAAASPSAAIVRSERAEAVRLALGELPDRYRLPLSLRYLEGLDPGEIAERLGLSSGAVRGQLHRGLAKLREKLGALGRELREEGHVRCEGTAA